MTLRISPGAIVLAVASLSLAACANGNTVFRNTTLKSGSTPTVITVDAKQRSTVIVPEHVPTATTTTRAGATIIGGGETRQTTATTPGSDGATSWRVCAEAAPDVFSVLSTSASGDLGLGASDEVKLRAALALAESGSSIERTQTVNLLRELMYRTCERYLSGAIGKAELIVQAARDQRIMVSILAIEQLTQAARTGPVIISGGGTSASLGEASAAREEAQAAAAAAATADAALATAKSAYAALNTATPSCDDRLKVTDVAQVPAADKAAWTECKAAKEKVGKADLAASEAKAKRDSAERMAAAASGVGASTLAGGAVTPIKLDARSGADLAAVSKSVESIVRMTLESDEMQLVCMIVLRPPEPSQRTAAETAQLSAVSKACLDYFMTRADVETARLVAATKSGLVKSALNEGVALRAYLVKGPERPGDRWRALLTAANPAIVRSRRQALDKLEDPDAIVEAFIVLGQSAPGIRDHIYEQIPEHDR